MLSHIDNEGRPTMVDVGPKAVTERTAEARALVTFLPEVYAQLAATGPEGRDWLVAKGPVFATAVVAGIQAAKRTWDLIPLCHPLPLDAVTVECHPRPPTSVEVRCRVKTTHKTGVEMEALTGASVAALTLYDMTKALSSETVIESVALVAKRGGRRDVGP